MKLELRDEDDDSPIRRGSLMTVHERQLAESRAQLLKAFETVEQATSEAQKARLEAAQLREHIIVQATRKSKLTLKGVLSGIAAVMMTMVVIKIAYFGFTQPPPAISASPAGHAAPVHERTALPTKHADPKGSREFDKAITRLQDAFDSLPDDKQEIIHEINQKNPAVTPCPFTWTNGAIALVLGGGKGAGSPSLVTAIGQCADATEKLRAEREAALPAASEKAQ